MVTVVPLITERHGFGRRSVPSVTAEVTFQRVTGSGGIKQSIPAEKIQRQTLWEPISNNNTRIDPQLRPIIKSFSFHYRFISHECEEYFICQYSWYQSPREFLTTYLTDWDITVVHFKTTVTPLFSILPHSLSFVKSDYITPNLPLRSFDSGKYLPPPFYQYFAKYLRHKRGESSEPCQRVTLCTNLRVNEELTRAWVRESVGRSNT